MNARERTACIVFFCSVFNVLVATDIPDNITEQSLYATASSLEMFVDEVPRMPTIQAYSFHQGAPETVQLRIGMFQTKWKFHRDLPPSTVFAYGTSRDTATVPGPTIEALQGVDAFITWENHLPSQHILPWDPTIMIAKSPRGGIPTVVHLHGGIIEPESDGHPFAWFTPDFKETGPAWSKSEYHYANIQHPGNLWYHDHALGLTRVNVLAGLLGAYVIRNPSVENRLNLPSGPEYDRSLFVFDRSFATDGSVYMNATSHDPSVHPQWEPVYFGEAILVNGKAWPYMNVQRTKYRFRIVNACNTRFFGFALSNGLGITQIGSDSAYLPSPVNVKELLLGPSEIADIVIDFSNSSTDEAILTNSAKSPFPSGREVDNLTNKVMKFVIESPGRVGDAQLVGKKDQIPERLVNYDPPGGEQPAHTRYITMYEFEVSPGDPTRLLLNGLSFDAPPTETPRQGTSELWHVINLTLDTHPLHIHLGLLAVLNKTKLLNLNEFKRCMEQKNDTLKCNIEKHARGETTGAPLNERGWKNVFKMQPGFMTTIVVRFSLLDSRRPYPFNACAEPGYVYHCHILDHEDNEMMRPLKILP